MVKEISVFQDGWVRTSPSDHPPMNSERLSLDDAVAVAAYLENGTPIMHTTARTTDVLADDGDTIVPLTIRTDGEFVWTGPVTYYVRTYAIAPDQEFVEAIRARNFEQRIPSDHEIEAAVAHFTA